MIVPPTRLLASLHHACEVVIVELEFCRLAASKGAPATESSSAAVHFVVWQMRVGPKEHIFIMLHPTQRL